MAKAERLGSEVGNLARCKQTVEDKMIQGKSELASRQSRYNSITDSLEALTRTISELENLTIEIAGSIDTFKEPNQNIKTQPDPANIAFIVASLPSILSQLSRRIDATMSKLRESFI